MSPTADPAAPPPVVVAVGGHGDDDARAGARRVTWVLRAGIGLLALAGIAGLLVVGPATARRPDLVRVGAAVPAVGFAGFSEISVSVTAGPGLPTQLQAQCFVLADTLARQERGLMGRRSIGHFDGMLFTFDAPTTDVFYMADTPLPLSVAWFDDSGRFIAEADMQPCPPGTAHCPFTASPSAYLSAVEVPEGALPGLGIGPGSTLHSGGPCLGGVG